MKKVSRSITAVESAVKEKTIHFNKNFNKKMTGLLVSVTVVALLLLNGCGSQWDETDYKPFVADKHSILTKGQKKWFLGQS